MTLLKKLWLLLLQQTLGTEESTQDIKPSSTTGTGGEDDGGDTGDDGDTGDIEIPETVVLPLKKASQYSAFGPTYLQGYYPEYSEKTPDWLSFCNHSRCRFGGAASFDSEDNLLIPSGELSISKSILNFDSGQYEDINLFSGYSTFQNEYFPQDFNTINCCYKVDITGIENYDINDSWYQEANLLNCSFIDHIIQQDDRYEPYLPDTEGGTYLFFHHFCSQNYPTSMGYNKIYCFLDIGTDDPRGIRYGNVCPMLSRDNYNGLWDYIYQYKNREQENRPKLYVWAIVVIVGDNIRRGYDGETPNNSSSYHVSTNLYFVKNLGEYKGDYIVHNAFDKNGHVAQYNRTSNSILGAKVSPAYMDLNSNYDYNMCDYLYYHGDLDLRHLSFTVTYDDLWTSCKRPWAVHHSNDHFLRDINPVPLCDISDINIDVNVANETTIVEDNVATNCQHQSFGTSFLSQLSHPFTVDYTTYEDIPISGIPGFNWYLGQGYPFVRQYASYGDVEYTHLKPVHPFAFKYYNISTSHLGALSSYLTLEISGVSPIVSGVDDLSKHDCNRSSELNGNYTLTDKHHYYENIYNKTDIEFWNSFWSSSTSWDNTSLDYGLWLKDGIDAQTSNTRQLDGPFYDETVSIRKYTTDINPICCTCLPRSYENDYNNHVVDGSGCVTGFDIVLSANSGYYTENNDHWYSTKLQARIAGHIYEHNFQNWGKDLPQPIDFNGLTVNPKLVRQNPMYSDIHDFSNASVSITFGSVDSIPCIPNSERCVVFDDDIGPENIIVNIPNDWQNGKMFRGPSYSQRETYGAPCNRICYPEQEVKCGYNEDGEPECRWFNTGRVKCTSCDDDGYDEIACDTYSCQQPESTLFNIDPLDWCNNLTHGEYILDRDPNSECGWFFCEECSPTGVMPPENDPNYFFETEESTDLYELLYDDNVDDLYLYGTTDVEETTNNCQSIQQDTDNQRFFRDDGLPLYPWLIDSYGYYWTSPLSCPFPYIILNIYQDSTEGKTNEFIVRVSILLAPSSDANCSNENRPFIYSLWIVFEGKLESKPGTAILKDGKPLYKYYITEEMLNGLQLEYVPTLSSSSNDIAEVLLDGDEEGRLQAPVEWGGQPITLHTV